MNNTPVIVFVLVGALAQLIDGSLGMGYKTSTTTFLLSFGVPPVFASSSVHIGGIFTSAASGLSHWKLGNLDKTLFKQLVLPGIIGGIIGAVLLIHIPTQIIKPLVALYLLVMGVRIILKALQQKTDLQIATRTTPLGFFGGFFDAIGGGGWGPIVTSTLMMDGHHPRIVVGSVNIAEFFVTLFQSITFLFLLQKIAWNVVIGLIIGGVATAPMAAYLTRFIPAQRLMLLVGILVMTLSLRTFLVALIG
ncbi:MAG: hypothetical protein CUN56_04890 [Phototrophicales bacterium]|nr:MAG: hypothetical protein CUN56_04890 [Phototrophicales bacterium]RMG71714.1 MAG: sulfite exporter TauE/SafE family protein [Chloroflexota bacterium]